MKKRKFITEFPDIPSKRPPEPSLPLEDRKGNFKEVELGYSEEQAIAEARRCLSCRRCIGCGLCLAECPLEAIVYDQKDEAIKLKVGSVILAPGFDEFDANLQEQFGYSQYPNVITSIELERILSPNGPYGGLLLRPSDGEIPKRIAFIQCVGSREEFIGANFCSSVCCNHMIKQTISAHQKVPDILTSVFFRDIRPLGKGYEDYYLQLMDQPEVKFINSIPKVVKEEPSTRNLVVEWEKGSEKESEEFDLVVLSVGLWAPQGSRRLGRLAGIQLNKYNFCHTTPFSPLTSSKPGIFVAGAFSSPKDISQSLAQASGAASKSASILGDKRELPKAAPRGEKEIKASNKENRIGVFICPYIGVSGEEKKGEGWLEYARSLSGVLGAEVLQFPCWSVGREEIKKTIQEKGLNWVVVVGCQPSISLPIFQRSVEEAGLSRQRLIMESAFKGAAEDEEIKRAIAKAVERAGEATEEPVSEKIVPVGLVIGGGISGLTAALDMAANGFQVHLVEKGSQLGGGLLSSYYTLEGEDVQEKVKSLVEEVERNERIRIYTEATVQKIEGREGNFLTELTHKGSPVKIEHGVCIIATGAEEYEPREYLYGEQSRVMTQKELEGMLAKGEPLKGKVAMIQCVGSRNEEHPYCSRFCCGEALKNALKIKEAHPESEVYILHKDIRVYGFEEDFFTDTVDKGVHFLRHQGDLKVVNSKGLQVEFTEAVNGERVTLSVDNIVLSTGVVPPQSNKALADMIGVDLDKDGFFKEVHPKFRPLELSREGFFVCGLAHSPQTISEAISQGSGAAGRACRILVKAL
ncbi:heterodisulfide reductase [bacterium (candidate division B38) B3_B38]|nr:MAG: heterodisulfide reductase [bacterium (candidate division B38) B3_B38]